MIAPSASRSAGVAGTPSLKSNILYAGVGNALFALTQWGILSIVARLGTAEEVGAITIAAALVTPLFFLASMGMRDGHAVDDLDRFSRADYVALRVVSSVLAFLIVLLLVVTYRSSSGWLVQSTTLAFATVKFFGAQATMNHGIFQRAERMDYVARSMLSRGLLGLAAFAAAYWLTGDLPLALLCEAGAWWACVWLVDRRMLEFLGTRTSMAEVLQASLKNVGRLALWLLPLGLSISLMRAAGSAPPLVLERHVDLATVGVFGAVAYVNTALSTVSGAIGTASAARLRRLYRAGERRRFGRLVLKLSALSTAVGAALVGAAWLFGDAILASIYGAGYRRGDLLVIVVIASALRIAGAPFQFALTAGQAFGRRFVNNAVTFAAALVAALVLVPRAGAMGAAWAMVIATAVNLLLTTRSFQIVSGMIVVPPVAPGDAARTSAQ